MFICHFESIHFIKNVRSGCIHVSQKYIVPNFIIFIKICREQRGGARIDINNQNTVILIFLHLNKSIDLSFLHRRLR